MDIKDLAGFGHATEKFLGLVQSSIGTLYRPRAIRKEGEASARAEAYKIVAVAKANVEARQIAVDGEQALVERAIARLQHQELTKQRNIEAIIDQTIPKIARDAVQDRIVFVRWDDIKEISLVTPQVSNNLSCWMTGWSCSKKYKALQDAGAPNP